MSNPALLAATREQRPKFDLKKICFNQQLKFIEDESRLKALFCTRRAAKSYTGGIYLIKEALQNPGCNCLFVALSRDTAKGIIWKDILKEIDLKYRLQIKFNETELSATFPNGSVIRVTGADADESEMNKLLGKKYRLVILDEASMFSVDMSRLVYGVLKPATSDQRGIICLLGTSSNITRGLFYDISTRKEPGWSLHTWTAHDNPHVATQWKEELEDIAKNRPLFMNTPLFKQWYLNEWAVDEEARVYKFNGELNRRHSLPVRETPYRYVLGVDLGHSPDPSAFVVGAYHETDPTLYFIHAEKHLEFDVTDVANKIKFLDKSYAFDVKVIDNANKQAVAELNNRHQVNVLAADKSGKADFINLMNAEFIQQKIVTLAQAKELEDELSTLVWTTDNGVVKIPRTEHSSLPNHLCDAALYLWRHCYSYLWEPLKKNKPSYGSPGWHQQEAESMLEREIHGEEMRLQQEAEQDHWNTFGLDTDDQINYWVDKIKNH